MVNATKEELAAAFKTWNIEFLEFLENPSNFGSETESSDEYAERQASKLIEYINRVQEL